jgi:membrane protease YdiL (CAAX protease family)
MASISLSTQSDPSHLGIRPMGFVQSLAYFGVPALGMVVGFHLVRPWLVSMGLQPFYAYGLGLGVPLALLWLAAILAHRRECSGLTLQNRLRLHPMNGKTWLWVLATSIVGLLGAGLLAGLSFVLINNGFMPLPANLPAALDPRTTNMQSAFLAFYGELRHNWALVAFYAVLLVFNIMGEEYWWRGYILPRQELAFGKWAWLVHGLMWAGFHVFKWWDVLNLVPICLGISLMVSRLKNTTPGIIVHFIVNGIGWVIVVLGAVGML